jgi:hypothetical protein
MGRTLARAVRGMAYGVMGAYLGAVLLFVTVGIIDSFVHPHGAEVLWTRESLYASITVIVAYIIDFSCA